MVAGIIWPVNIEGRFSNGLEIISWLDAGVAGGERSKIDLEKGAFSIVAD
jgi:hypothetical protein